MIGPSSARIVKAGGVSRTYSRRQLRLAFRLPGSRQTVVRGLTRPYRGAARCAWQLSRGGVVVLPQEWGDAGRVLGRWRERGKRPSHEENPFRGRTTSGKDRAEASLVDQSRADPQRIAFAAVLSVTPRARPIALADMPKLLSFDAFSAKACRETVGSCRAEGRRGALPHPQREPGCLQHLRQQVSPGRQDQRPVPGGLHPLRRNPSRVRRCQRGDGVMDVKPIRDSPAAVRIGGDRVHFPSR